MPQELSTHYQDIDVLLKSYYSLSRWGQWFFPTRLKKALIEYESSPQRDEAALKVVVAFIENTWFFHKWFFSCLQLFSESDLVKGFRHLDKAHLLTGGSAQEIFNAVVSHQYPSTVVWALETLNEANLLTSGSAQDNFEAVAKHQYPMAVAQALETLNRAHLLTGDSAQENRNAVANHQEPMYVAWALETLNRAHLLTGDSAQENRNAVANHQEPRFFYTALGLFDNARALNQIHCNQLIEHTPILFGDERTQAVWDRIPHRALTQPHITAIFDLCRQHHANTENARNAFVDYINQHVLPQDAQRHGVRTPVINAGQSTHTASVHQSVSQSATNLMNLYRDQILGDRLETTIKNISNNLKSSPEDTLHIADAINCLKRITADDYFFTDSTSKVSTKQLLALAWHAIHDDTKRIGALDDAKHLFIEGLYEAQRGYNLSEANVDRGGVDRPICVAGTFNKIMEKLAGIHLDAQIIYITPATTALKLPVIAKEEAENYLTSIANPSTRDEYLNAVRIMEDVKSDGMEIIWPHIKEKVAQRVFGEFGSLYRDINDERFVEMVDAGVDVDVSEIPETFQQKMMESNGYFAYCRQALLLSQGFFANSSRAPMADVLAANRNNSAEDRRLFDINFGLVVRQTWSD